MWLSGPVCMGWDKAMHDSVTSFKTSPKPGKQYTPLIPALRRLSKADLCELKASQVDVVSQSSL